MGLPPSAGSYRTSFLEDYPQLTAADLANAGLYASTHEAEIAAAIQPQEAA